MHETHTVPAIVGVLDLAGGRHPKLLQHHTATRANLVAAAWAYAIAYTTLCHAAALQTLAWPYPFMTRLSAGWRILFCNISAGALSLLTLVARRAVLWRTSHVKKRV